MLCSVARVVPTQIFVRGGGRVIEILHVQLTAERLRYSYEAVIRLRSPANHILVATRSWALARYPSWQEYVRAEITRALHAPLDNSLELPDAFLRRHGW